MRGPVLKIAVWGIAAASQAFVGPVLAETRPQGAVKRVLDQRKAANEASARSQRKVDELSTQADAFVQEYRTLQEAILPLRAQNAQLERLIAQQAESLLALDRQVGEVARVRHSIMPLLKRMLASLDEFVALDLPFLSKERAKRSMALHALMRDASASVASQSRRIFEAYMVELEYGRKIEAYEDQIDLDGVSTAVEMLRVGRVGLYYLSLDGERAGRYSRRSGRFEPLDAEQAKQIRSALQVAKKRIPPQLIELPVARTPRAKGVRS